MMHNQGLLYFDVANGKMWKVIWFMVLISTGLLVTAIGNDNMLGNGRLFIHTVLECDDKDQYEIPMEVTRKKINRTHDCFDIYIGLDRELNDSYSIKTLVDKEVDGGYKFYTQFGGEKICSFLEEHGKSNWRNALELANINPPECPVPAGDVRIKGLVMDFEDMTKTGIYGNYDVMAYLMFAEKRLACSRWLVSFENTDGSDDDFI